MTPATAPGWYGKLPTLGDFASRRLEPAFIEPWDAWLAGGLAAQRSTLGDAWVRAYLHSPAWRFVLMPGVIGAGRARVAWGGVLMPSVDQVGRYFPLTLVAPLATLPAGAGEVEALLGWLQRLEDVAVDAMQDDWDIGQLEGVLAAMAPDWRPGPDEPTAATNALAEAIDAGAGFVELDGVANRSDLAQALVGALAHHAGDTWRQGAEGRTFWLADDPVQPRLLVRRGLPEPSDVVEMLAGRSRDADATTLL